jgi:hypothetical protein
MARGSSQWKVYPECMQRQVQQVDGKHNPMNQELFWIRNQIHATSLDVPQRLQPICETRNGTVSVVYSDHAETRNIVSKPICCIKKRRNIQVAPHACEISTLAMVVHIQNLYDTIHQAPTKIATKTSSVKMLAPALSPVVMLSNRIMVSGASAPASGLLAERPPAFCVAGPGALV